MRRRNRTRDRSTSAGGSWLHMAIVCGVLISLDDTSTVAQPFVDGDIAMVTGVATTDGTVAGDGSDCCRANGTPGCSDPVCEHMVCNRSPFCCDVQWDQLCADLACDSAPCDCCAQCGDGVCESAETCATCPSDCPCPGDCCAPNDTPECDDPACTTVVCARDKFCCDRMWDLGCVELACEVEDCGCEACDDVCGDGACGKSESCASCPADCAPPCSCATDADCDDRIPCTLDTCDLGTNTCLMQPDDAACDNGSFCDGVETCDAKLGCLEGDPVDCDDGVVCTVDSCDVDACVNVPVDAACDDGLFCNGLESCDARLGCVANETPCPDGPCDEAKDQCVILPPTGACCLPDGACAASLELSECEDGLDGQYQGDDSTCAEVSCLICPPGIIVASDPPAGVLDARQPHPPGGDADQDPANRQGIGAPDDPIGINLNASGASAGCFTLCETAPDPVLGANSIVSVTENPPMVYAIVLHHAIAPGSWTAITYGDGDSVHFLSHPANANADGFSNANDALALIDMLNEATEPPFGMLSTDINRSGVFDATDVLRLIDLLNGAIPYAPWLNVATPIDTCP